MSSKKQFEHYEPSRVRGFIIDDSDNLVVDFGNNKRYRFLGVPTDEGLK